MTGPARGFDSPRLHFLQGVQHASAFSGTRLAPCFSIGIGDPLARNVNVGSAQKRAGGK